VVEKLIICGIDEVGRGPLAGPVMAAAVILPERLPNFFIAVTDSKKLSSQQREKLFPLLMSCCDVGIGMATVEEIDQYNILQATFFAMQRAVQNLPVAPHKAFVDGNRAPKLPCAVETVIGGDAKVPAIAAASIIAKVTRDRLMVELDKQYPGYGWALNAGYGTAVHQQGLEKLGPTPHHRRSFAPVREIIQKIQIEIAA
jgi:ribonuclease HII